jgi:threonylcarbamoyladenosine tRNA methylthiotransferase MtaB
MERGYGEAVLTGIHLGQWGSDLRPRRRLFELLSLIESELRPQREKFRLRLSSLEPGEAFEALQAFQEFPWLARHLHIPLQSGSQRILSAMGRPCRLEDYQSLVECLRRSFPLMALGTDVMAGFPGEGEREFKESYDLVEKLPFSYLHVFPYSEREGTRAAGMPGQVRPGMRKERAARLKALDKGKREAFKAISQGERELALAENRQEAHSRRQRALTGNYLEILLPEGIFKEPGRLYPCRIGPPISLGGLCQAELERP